jgi:undecaprenyl-diphosphatase
LFLGLQRETAARFSFLLSAPIIAGAGAKSLFNIYNSLNAGQLSQGELALFPIGFVAAALSGYLCIKYLLQYLQKNSTDLFVFYRWALAVVVLAFAVLRG